MPKLHRNARLSKAARSKKFTSKRIRAIQQAKKDAGKVVGNWTPYKFEYSASVPTRTYIHGKNAAISIGSIPLAAANQAVDKINIFRTTNSGAQDYSLEGARKEAESLLSQLTDANTRIAELEKLIVKLAERL